MDVFRAMATYVVVLDDDDEHLMIGLCLAAICAKVRGHAKRIRIWAPSGIQLIDTKFGDSYNIALRA